MGKALENNYQDKISFAESNKSNDLMNELGESLGNHTYATIDEYVGKKLRDFRERANLTLLECAQKVGVSHQQIHKYEMGQTKISTGMLYEFCKVFSVTPNCFYEGYSQEPKRNTANIDESTAFLPSIDKINVLLIDDNSEDQFLIRRILDEYDFKINFYCIHNGEEFLDIVKKDINITKIPLPDIILIDLNMPKINGKELLRYLKQNRELKHIPVLILTGSISRKDILDCYKNYASGYIRKSFEYEKLKKSLHLAINYWIDAVILPQQAWS